MPDQPEFDHTAALRVLWRELAEKRIESGADWPYIARTLFRDLDDAARTIDDLRSRLGCVAEASYWDRPYDTRLDAIRGMCDLTTNGTTPASEMSTPPAVSRADALAISQGRRTEAEARKCSQEGCRGDGRYQPPGKGHLPGCQHNAIEWVWEQISTPPAGGDDRG